MKWIIGGVEKLMRSSKNQKTKIAAVILCMSILLPACSTENMIRLLSADKNIKDTSDDTSGQQMTYTEDDSTHHQIGDSFEVAAPTQDDQNNIGYICTVESVQYYSSVADEEIDQTKLEDSVEYYTDEEPQTVEKNEYKQYGIVLCKMKLKNINMPEDYNITECAFMSVDENKNVHLISMPVYFDAQEKNEEDGKEYHCEIPVGEEREIVIGWLVNLNQYPADSLYVQVPYGADDEWVNYVQLNLQTEGKQE